MMKFIEYFNIAPIEKILLKIHTFDSPDYRNNRVRLIFTYKYYVTLKHVLRSGRY